MNHNSETKITTIFYPTYKDVRRKEALLRNQEW
jgi:hypothetical protein